jgi:hypothetical protein
MTRADWHKVLSSVPDQQQMLADGSMLRERFDALRKHAAVEPLIREIKEAAEHFLEEPIPLLLWSKHRLYMDEGSRLPYEELYFARRRRLTALALMALLEPDEERYLSGLEDLIWAICDEYSWCLPAHLPRSALQHAYSIRHEEWLLNDHRDWIDLFAAETAFSLAEIGNLLRDRLPPVLLERVRHEVYRRVLYPYMNRGPFGWEEARHNWSAVCAGSIVSAAIYLIDDPDELGAVMERAIRSLGCFLDGYEDDGACMEGIYYWGYGFGFYVYAADLIQRRTNGNIDLLASPKIREIAAFQHKCFLSGDKVVNFADSGPVGRVNLGLTHYLAKRFPECEVPDQRLRARFADDHCGRWAPALRNLLWLDPDLPGKPWGDASYWLKDVQWLISRKAGEDGMIVGFAAKGGHNDEPHNHNDIGHFILHAGGVSILPDMGWGMYSAQYFSEERYSFICTSSAGHSVPIVNGVHQVAGRERKAQVLNVACGEQRDVLELELAGAYPVDRLQSLVRRFEWRKEQEPSLVLTDSYRFGLPGMGDGEPIKIVERFICVAHPVKVARNCYLVDGGKHAHVRIYYEFDQVEADVEKLEMIDHHGKKVEYYALDFAWTVKEEACTAKFEFRFV